MIEDQVWPKRCGHMQGKSVIDADEMVQKVRAAVAARRSPDFVVKARTDAFATHGLDEAIRRLNLYAEAGADLLLADALAKESDIAAVAKAVSSPLASIWASACSAHRPRSLFREAHEDGGRRAIMYGRMLSASALRASKTAWKPSSALAVKTSCDRNRPSCCFRSENSSS